MQCNEALSRKSYPKYLEADKMRGKVEESVMTHFNGPCALGHWAVLGHTVLILLNLWILNLSQGSLKGS